MKINFKRHRLLLSICAIGLLTACSGDDDAATSGNASCTEILWYLDADGDGLGNPTTSISACDQPIDYVDNNDDDDDSITNYIPLTQSNYWTFDTEVTDPQGGPATIGRDSLYAATTTTINGNLYTDLDATATSNGVMTGILAQNFIRRQNDKLYLKGTLNLDLTPAGGSVINIDIDDAILLDANGNLNEILYSSSGSITEPITIGGQNVTLLIDYTIKSIQKENINTMSVNGNTYTEVLKSNLIMSAKIDAQVTIGGFPVTLSVAPQQDINTIENYYANNIGLIQSDVDFNIDLDPTTAGQFGLPTNINAPSFQLIDTYLIN